MGILESLTNAGGSIFAGREAKKREQEAEEDYWDRLNRMDLNYAQTAETAPTFQVAQSPVARAYLESFLTGSNPDAVMSTRHGSGAAKANAERGFNEDFGGWSKLVGDGRAERGDESRFHVDPSDSSSTNAMTRSLRSLANDDRVTERYLKGKG